MAKTVHVRYFTKDKKDLINKENIKKYEKYLRSNIIKNKEVENTTYKTYKNYFTQFLVYLAEQWDNIDLYSEDFFDNAIDIMEGFMCFCQDTLKNNKKVINTKLSAVSSFFLWSQKRRLIKFHPFGNGMLERMKKAQEEHIVNSYFLTIEEQNKIDKELRENKDKKYDLLDLLLWNIMIDSANRIGAIHSLKLSQLDLDNNCFTNIREKEGYRVEVSFEDDTKEIIQAWLEYRKENMDNLEIDALFISKYKGEYRQMGKTTLQNRIRKIGEIVGLDDFHAHCTRKTASNTMIEEGVDPSLVAHYLNHKDVSTTLNYYCRKKSSSEIKKEIREQIKKFKEKENK